MQWISLAIRLIPKAIELIKIAEKLFDSVPDSGAQKKEYVMQAIRAIVEGLSGITGTQEMWDKIQEAISPVIDIACYFLFPKEKPS